MVGKKKYRRKELNDQRSLFTQKGDRKESWRFSHYPLERGKRGTNLCKRQQMVWVGGNLGSFGLWDFSKKIYIKTLRESF